MKIQVFSHDQFGQIRTIIDENGEPLFCVKDLCSALELDGKQVVRRLEKGVVSKHPLSTKGGIQELTFVNESGLYDVILDSRKPEARKFRKWVTAEVLPQIRRTGGYIPVSNDDDEKSILAKALLICQKTIAEQQSILEAQKPDVTFATAVRASEGSILIGNLAKLISQNGVPVGQNRLFEWMRSHGYLGNRGRHHNIALQRYIDRGLFELDEQTVETDCGTFTHITTLVTGLGQQYFINGFVEGRFNLSPALS